MYKAVCRAIAEYGCYLYCNSIESTKQILYTAETISLRKITGLRHPDNVLHNPPNRLLYEMSKVTPLYHRKPYLYRKLSVKETWWDTISHLLLRKNDRHSKYKFPAMTLLEFFTNYV